MSDELTRALRDCGPHTVESVAARLPGFPAETIRAALEALAEQGVLEREAGADGITRYRYVAPERYAQVNLDVVRDPAPEAGSRKR